MKNSLYVIYAMGFLSALHYAIPLYVNSSFIETFLSEKGAAILFPAANIFAILSLIFMPRILFRFGDFRITAAVFIADAAALGGILFFDNPWILAACMLAHLLSFPVIVALMDIFLEHSSTNERTGGIRGMYLTSVNAAIMFAPFLAGFLLSDGNYRNVYFFSLIVLIPLLVLFFRRLSTFVDSPYRRASLIRGAGDVLKSKDLRNIFFANFLLWFFYAWMIIYMPIYLREHIGFTWEEIGIMFAVMLFPFVIFEATLGRIADRWLGEKEILTAGFVIAALGTIGLSFVSEPDMLLWTALLFTTRVGASFIEVMSETYFFKQVSDSDAHILGFFRLNNPLSFVVAPLVAALFLYFFDIRLLFLLLGLIMLWGVRYSLAIRDTR
ncbi:MFS transporter [bacterium]|nr:MFS transporter [bacterium]